METVGQKCIDSFEEKYIPEPMSGCWLWMASVNQSGYGNFWESDKCWKAHRFSYLIYKKEDPGNLYVLHKCDNPSCVNPDHLYLGTQSDNMKDRDSRTGHGLAKLSADDVILIRQSNESCEKLAKKFGVGSTTIHYARNGTNWKSINE